MIDSIINISPISFTEGAVHALNKLLAAESDSSKKLRIGVKGGGCAGFTYILEMDMVNEGDQTYEFGGIPYIMHISHQLYLQGVEIDYSEGLNNRGFVFSNPNASKTCGCGTSFS